MKKRLTLSIVLSLILFVFAGCVATNKNAATGTGKDEINQFGEFKNDEAEGEPVQNAQQKEQELEDENEGAVQDYTRPSLGFTLGDIVVSGGYELVSYDEMELVKKFVLCMVWSLEGYNLEEEIKALNDEIFWEESSNREDYKQRIQRFEEGDQYFYKVQIELALLDCIEKQVGKVYEVQVITEVDFGVPAFGNKPIDSSNYGDCYYITVIEDDGQLVIKSYVSKFEFDTYRIQE